MALRVAIFCVRICDTTVINLGNRRKDYKGVVRGIIVRAPTIAQGILGGLKSIIGGAHRCLHPDV
jgi:uncharacterized protein YbjQ (UPF0145 family)